MIHLLGEVEDVVGGGSAAVEHDDGPSGFVERGAEAMDGLVLVRVDGARVDGHFKCQS
jgi:hypothetical protein